MLEHNQFEGIPVSDVINRSITQPATSQLCCWVIKYIITFTVQSQSLDWTHLANHRPAKPNRSKLILVDPPAAVMLGRRGRDIYQGSLYRV